MFTDSKELGKQIASLRKKHGLSQIELAKLCGIPVIAVRRCEQNGAIPLHRYVALMKLLKNGTNVMEVTSERYQTINEVIQSRKDTIHQPTLTARKPKLGGMFDRMTQST